MGTNREMTNLAIDNYLSRVSKTILSIRTNDVEFLGKKIKEINKNGGGVYVVGNGGSAALANHFATDIGVGALKHNKPVKIISLVSNISSLTASANDYGYEFVFSRELEILSTSQDLLILISSSGNSLNLLEAAKIAKERGVQTFGILGFDGGKLKTLVDHYIHVESRIGDYGIIEDCHSIILHAITEALRI
jgi:D-sedoheptulose 7-phosphate isomerase